MSDILLRDYLAAQALPQCIRWVIDSGIEELRDENYPKYVQPCIPDKYGTAHGDLFKAAEAAYLFADAMLMARDNKIEMDFSWQDDDKYGVVRPEDEE
jgi:hypothetical protein